MEKERQEKLEMYIKEELNNLKSEYENSIENEPHNMIYNFFVKTPEIPLGIIVGIVLFVYLNFIRMS